MAPRTSVYRKNGGTESTEDLRPVVRIDSAGALVVGTTQLFEGDRIRYIPMPTPDPKDPLNLPAWRKWTAIMALCFFGALALASETIIGALVPVFALEYAGIDPKIIGQIDLSSLVHGEVNLNPLSALASLGGPPLWQITLLSSLPLLVNGIASYFLVPLSIAIGRRPVLLTAGILAFSGGWWAGYSQSLPSHLAARCFQGLGAGAVEALIPLIVQDMMFIHQRNKSIALIGASQGFIIVGIGIASPLIIVRLSWRYIYWITSGVAMFAWILLFVFVPESRWIRSPDELAGKEVYPLRPGETRPRLEVEIYGPRTNMADFGIFVAHPEWRLAMRSVWDTMKTTIFPNVLWVILVNSALIAIQGAAGQVASAVLIASGWQFETLGLIVLPIVVASPLVWFFGGFVADKISNLHAKWHGGRREPEAHLLSVIVPLIAAIAGSLLFGYAGQNIKTLPGFVVLLAVFLVGFGFLTTNTIFAVYLVESYPAFAG
jgi:MFS family permease